MAVEIQSKYIDYCEGGYYVADTRIGLDVIAYEFRNGQLPEDILRSYPSKISRQGLRRNHVYLGTPSRTLLSWTYSHSTNDVNWNCD